MEAAGSENDVADAKRLYDGAKWFVLLVGASGFIALIVAHGPIALLGLVAFPFIVYVPMPGPRRDLSFGAAVGKLRARGFGPERVAARAYWVRSVSVAALGGSIASAYWALAFARPGSAAAGADAAVFAIATSAEIVFAWFFLFYGLARGFGR